MTGFIHFPPNCESSGAFLPAYTCWLRCNDRNKRMRDEVESDIRSREGHLVVQLAECYCPGTAVGK